MYLFFDTETTGLPADYNAPESDTDNWPRLVQLAWIIGDSVTTMSELKCCVVQPDGFEIPTGASDIHGIYTAEALADGVPLQTALTAFFKDIERVTTVVGHNIEFDVKIIGAECARISVPNPLHGKHLRCTKNESTEYCKIPGSYGYKWPTLDQLHIKLFDVGFPDEHDAGGDTLACMKCFYKLQDLGVM